MKEIIYPQYRRYHNGQNYFKISSPAELEEIRFIGEKCIVHQLRAKILPDRNFIFDLTFNYAAMAVAIEKEEYKKVLDDCLVQSFKQPLSR